MSYLKSVIKTEQGNICGGKKNQCVQIHSAPSYSPRGGAFSVFYRNIPKWCDHLNPSRAMQPRGDAGRRRNINHCGFLLGAMTCGSLHFERDTALIRPTSSLEHMISFISQLVC